MVGRHQAGFTVIELTVVMSIVVGVLIVSANTILGYQRYSMITQIQRVTSELRHATQDYYHVHCRDTVFIQPTLTRLINEGFIVDTLSLNSQYSSGTSFSINTASIPPSYTFSTRVLPGNNPSLVARLFHADNVVGRSISWNGFMINNYDYDDNEFRLMRTYYGEDC